MSLADELRERTALRYVGDCKCGHCQLVPRELLDRAVRELSEVEFARIDKNPMPGMVVQDNAVEPIVFNHSVFALTEMAGHIRKWLTWHRLSREAEGLTTASDTTIMALPMKIWPSHAMFEHWIKAMERAAQEHADMLRLLKRYRAETPLGNQPHMIAHEADEVIGRAETRM